MFKNELCQLWSYWTEDHEIFTGYTGGARKKNNPLDKKMLNFSHGSMDLSQVVDIIYTVNAHI